MDEFLEQLEQIESTDPDEYRWLIEQRRADRKLKNMLNAIDATNLQAEADDRANNPHMASFYDAIAQATAEGTQRALKF